MDTQQFYTPEQVTHLFQLTPHTVRRWCHEVKIEHTRLHNGSNAPIRIPVTESERLMVGKK